MKQFMVAAAIGFAVSANASASLVAGWTISTAVPAATTGSNYTYGGADQGDAAAGTVLSGFHAAAAATWSSPSGNGSTFSLSSNNWAIGDYYQVSVSTTGYSDISLTFDQTRSGTGPATFDVLMSVDGGANFTTLLAGYSVIQAGLAGSGTLSWSAAGAYQTAFTTTILSIAGASEQSSVIFRISSAVATAAAGTNRIDNINVYSGPVPAPGAIALLGLAGLAGRRRR